MVQAVPRSPTGRHVYCLSRLVLDQMHNAVAKRKRPEGASDERVALIRVSSHRPCQAPCGARRAPQDRHAARCRRRCSDCRGFIVKLETASTWNDCEAGDGPPSAIADDRLQLGNRCCPFAPGDAVGEWCGTDKRQDYPGWGVG